MESPIPPQWCQTVARILRADLPDTIITRERADLDWQAAFPSAWNFQRFEALAAALDSPGVVGCIHPMAEPGQTWAFWFHFEGRKLYGKINLTPGGQIIIIYSNHRPMKGESRL